MTDAGRFEHVNPELRKLKCDLCTSAKDKLSGAKIQCAHGRCQKAFHVSCAAGSGSGCYVDLEEQTLYCRAHNPYSAGCGEQSSAAAASALVASTKRKKTKR